MNFQKQLKRRKETLEANIPQDVLNIMHKATKELEDSGIQQKVLKVGQDMPAFELHDQNNESVNSNDLLSKGPLVITFYRGQW